ncbi:hypothetical protein BACOVA_04574 [Bacteroides ovatus ATCC 8483]|uniref:Uncharacterized protein n=1 Tax=Bacteroides ovatus (strain ATCC 8483 / DSM 1896 / JCM 5824 / BCRC 10623 / CCUG 4943 / NCTC 11153) TaxID=411476 RepID=A0AAN3A5F2_BACO1|nr:hypothetical protein BACOVA_04574 [Bacteroides ovatus ATCC 8483]
MTNILFCHTMQVVSHFVSLFLTKNHLFTLARFSQ